MSTPEEMSSRQLVDALLADGMSKADIGRAVGRDSSVVSQIESGKKPYANLRETLAATLANRRGGNVQVPEAPRRLDKQGQEAQVRKPTAGGRTVHVRSASAIKGGAKSIGKRLKIAERDGLRVAWTVVYPSWVEIGPSPKGLGKGHHNRAEPSNIADLGNGGRGYSASSFQRFVDDAGGNVGKGVTDWLVAQNMLDTPEVTPLSIELRTWQSE